MIINTTALVASYDRVFSQDPSLDREVADWRERLDRFHETSNADLLPLKAGKKPAIWRLRHLRGDAKLHVQSELRRAYSLPEDVTDMAVNRCAYVACALALESVTGLYDQDGTPLHIQRTRDSDTGLMLVAKPTMDLLFEIERGLLVIELGSVAINRLLPNPT